MQNLTFCDNEQILLQHRNVFLLGRTLNEKMSEINLTNWLYSWQII